MNETNDERRALNSHMGGKHGVTTEALGRTSVTAKLWMTKARGLVQERMLHEGRDRETVSEGA